MTYFETFRIAGRALVRNKMRSFLTALGIIIGVAAVIAMVAIGEGAKAQVEQAFASMGSNLLILMPGSTNTGGVRGGFGTMATLTWDDLHAIRTQVPAVRAASPQLRSNGQLVFEDQNWSTQLNGVSPEYFDVRDWKLNRGRQLTDGDTEGGTKIVLLGQTVVDKLFGPNSDPVGQVVRIKNIPFEVAGVLERKGQSPMGQDYDDAVFIPFTTFQSKIQGGLSQVLSGAVFIGARSFAETGRAEREIRALLRDRHRLQEGDDDDFYVRNLSELASAQEEGTRTLTTLLASIAAVSLLVGGIGIMNIMLVSVTERTREIGVRMALGARGRDILAQFLVESATLSLAGGSVGVLLGVGVAARLAKQFGWPVLMRLDVIGIAVAFSALVGIGFGLYPARKASKLNPIDALRFE